MSRATFTRAEVNALLDPTAGGIARGIMHHRGVVSSTRRPARGDIQLAFGLTCYTGICQHLCQQVETRLREKPTRPCINLPQPSSNHSNQLLVTPKSLKICQLSKFFAGAEMEVRL